MACFAAPATAAIITTAVKRKVPKKYHPEWLLSILWGGVLMLIVEHVAHQEVVPYFPFFTSGWSEMWPEILRVGLPMTLIIFIIWGAMITGIALAAKKITSKQEA